MIVEQIQEFPPQVNEILPLLPDRFKLEVEEKSPGEIHVGLPREFLLGSVLDGRFQVRGPIRVKCSWENERVIAEAPELGEFGVGENLSDALRDLQRAIADLYLTLEGERERLGPDLQKVWATLQSKINRRP